MFALFLVFGILFSNLHSSFASETDNQVITKKEAQRKAEIFVRSIGKQSYSQWINANLSESKTLNDLEGKVRGYLFQVQKDNQDYGYVIVNGSIHGSSIIESTREGSNPYKDVPEGQAVYAGPIQHLKKEGNKFTDLSSGETQEANNIKLEKNKVNRADLSSKNFNVERIVEDVYIGKKIYNVRDFAWYRGCTPTAVANVVAYWAYPWAYPRSRFPNLFKSNESAYQLIDNLGDYMKTTSAVRGPDGKVIEEGGFTYYKDMVPGIKKYWDSRGYPVESELVTSPTYEKFKNEINGLRPIVITTQIHPMYKNHSMTGVGYEELYNADLNEKYQNIIVHDTWTQTPVDVMLDYNEHASYFYSFLTINPFFFLDVPKEHWAYEQISYMAVSGIMNGYGNGNFGAKDNITREQLAAFLYRYILPSDTFENPFTDVNNSPFKKEILALTRGGVFSVDQEKKFNPKNTATRAEIAATLTKAFNLKVKANYEFNDMKGHWANEYVKALYSNGIAGGTGNKNFSPSASVTREQMAMFLYRAINMDPNYVPVPI